MKNLKQFAVRAATALFIVLALCTVMAHRIETLLLTEVRTETVPPALKMADGITVAAGVCFFKSPLTKAAAQNKNPETDRQTAPYIKDRRFFFLIPEHTSQSHHRTASGLDTPPGSARSGPLPEHRSHNPHCIYGLGFPPHTAPFPTAPLFFAAASHRAPRLSL